jgi:hypothetical protein
LRLQTAFYDEDISSDYGWAKQEPDAFFSRLQQYVRPQSKEQFIQILSNNAYFRQGFSEIDLSNWDEFLVAVYSYADRFRRLWAFMSMNNSENTPRVDNKDNGAIKLFLAKFPNQFGSNATRDLITKKYHFVETFIQDFLELLREQRNRLQAVTSELKKFGNFPQNVTAQLDNFQTPIRHSSNMHNGHEQQVQKLNLISTQLSQIENDSEGSFRVVDSDRAENGNAATPKDERLRDADEDTLDEDNGELVVMEHDSPNERSIIKPTFACYSKSLTGTCDAGSNCRKEHSHEACEAYVKTSLEKILRSPFLKAAEAQEIYQKYLQRSQQQPHKIAVVQRATAGARTERKLSVMDGSPPEETGLRPMHVQATINFGPDREVNLQCLLDSGASHGNYVSKKFLEKNLPEYKDKIMEVQTEVRTGNDYRISISQRINLPMRITHNNDTYETDLNCDILDNSSNDLVIGLPSICGALYNLMIKCLEEASQQFQQSLEVPVVSNVNITAEEKESLEPQQNDYLKAEENVQHSTDVSRYTQQTATLNSWSESQIIIENQNWRTNAILFCRCENILEVTAFTSHKFSKAALNWTANEKRAFGIFHALKVFRPLIQEQCVSVLATHVTLQPWANHSTTFSKSTSHIPCCINSDNIDSSGLGNIILMVLRFLFNSLLLRSNRYTKGEEEVGTIGINAIETFDPGGQETFDPGGQTTKSEIYKGKVEVDSYYLYCYVVVPSTPHVRITPELIKQFPELR